MHTILLIEPDTLLADTYRQALERAGYAVRQAAGAQEAIDAADRQTPDAVILELQLRGHGGIDFLYEFRSYAEWRRVPVIINSYLMPQDLAAVRPTLQNELAVNHYLYKPTASLDQLLNTLKIVL